VIAAGYLVRTNIRKWIGFVLVSLASLVAYRTACGVSFYWPLLACLAVAAVVMAFVVLRQTGAKLRSLAAVVGLVVGQWWLFQLLLVSTRPRASVRKPTTVPKSMRRNNQAIESFA